jgi:hypothetical protein
MLWRLIDGGAGACTLQAIWLGMIGGTVAQNLILMWITF